jgi:hypothetical protein
MDFCPWYEERDLNPHERLLSQDFKSCVSADSTILAENKTRLLCFLVIIAMVGDDRIELPTSCL